MAYSGNLPYSNKITIYDAESLNVVFIDTITTHLLKHTIPANTLTNGDKYAIECQMFDSNGTASALSDKVYFYCYVGIYGIYIFHIHPFWNIAKDINFVRCNRQRLVISKEIIFTVFACYLAVTKYNVCIRNRNSKHFTVF
jgi:hypothetical protein